MTAGVPLVDFRHMDDPDKRDELVATIGQALETYGFVSIAHHGIDLDLLHEAYDAAARVFELPEPVKKRYETPEDGRQRGYTSFGTEHAKDVAVADMKEFWQVGRSLGDDHPLHVSGDVPRNRFPKEVPEFGVAFSGLFDQMESFANQLLDCVGEHLDLEEGFFREMVEDSNSVLRVIHYPPLSSETLKPGAVRAARHEDINLLTVLPASTQSGLQLLTRDGEWLPIETPPDVMICDTGDMMQLLTAGRLPATTHRVVNPDGADASQPRYSMPFFLHPHPDAILEPLYPSDREPVRAADFLRQRLVEIGVM